MEQEGEMVTAIDLRRVTLGKGGFQEDDAVEEISLLLEPTLLNRLEEVAEQHGMTAASLIRSLLRNLLDNPATGQGISGCGPYYNVANTEFGQNRSDSEQRHPFTRRG
jgi:hypothetical protein